MINLSAVLISNGLGAALMLTLLLSNRKNTRSVFLDEKIFFMMCHTTLILCILETASFLVDRTAWTFGPVLNRILNGSLFILDISFSFLWTIYVDFKLFGQLRRLYKIYPFVSIPAVCIVALTVLNIWGIDIFYTVSQENVYTRTPYTYLVYLFTYIYLAIGAIMVFVYRKKLGKYLFMPMMVFLSPVLIGSLLQMFFYGIALIWVSVAFGLVSLYINLQNEIFLLDSLTKLYNREYLIRYLNYVSQKPTSNTKIAGIMIDINLFKSINDNFGHSEGDIALQLVAKCLMDVAQENQFVVRYGGDEFIMICNVRSQHEIEQVMEKIHQRVEEENQKNERPYRLSLSMGGAILNPCPHCIDRFLQTMDARMYSYKRKFYAESSDPIILSQSQSPCPFADYSVRQFGT